MDNAETTQRLEEIETRLDGLETKGRESVEVQRPGVQLTSPIDATSKQVIFGLVQYPICVRIQNTDAATAANYGVFFTADKTYRVVSAVEIHGTKGTDASAVTLQIERLQGTEAPDSGDALLTTAFDLKGNNNTVQYAALVKTDAVFLARGDRLCLKDSGTLTAVANLQVTVYIQTI